jgi:hypothetical protein
MGLVVKFDLDANRLRQIPAVSVQSRACPPEAFILHRMCCGDVLLVSVSDHMPSCLGTI